MKWWRQFSLVLPAALLTVQLSGAALAAGFYVSPSQQDANTADVGIDKRGNAIFSWRTFQQATGDVVVQIRKRNALGAFAAPQTLSTNGHDAQFAHIAVNGDGAAMAVWQLDNGDANATTPVQGRARDAGGALGPIFNVAPRPGGAFSYEFANPSVALDAAGNATFAWTGRDKDQEERAYARRRSAGGALGPILALSPPGATDPRMAVNAAGTAIFVWVWNDGAGHNLIQARRLSAAGALGRIKIIAQGTAGSGGGGLPTGNPQVGLDNKGNALIVWEQPDGQGPCGINGCPKILSRTLSKSDAVGTVPQTYTTTVSGGRSPRVAMAGSGDAVVAWLHEGVEFRTRSAGGALGPLRNFSASTSATEPVLKGDPAGNAVAIWNDSGFIRARALSAAGALEPTRKYSIGGHAPAGGVLAVGTQGDAAVAWVQSDGLGQCFGGSSCSRVGAAIDP